MANNMTSLNSPVVKDTGVSVQQKYSYPPYNRKREFIIEGKLYLIDRANERPPNREPHQIVSQLTQSVYSDHIPLSADIYSTRVITYNILANRAAWNEGIYNAYDREYPPYDWGNRHCESNIGNPNQYVEMITGDRFSFHDRRRAFIVDHLYNDILPLCDIMCLQEIDYETIQMLIACDVNVVFSEESPNCNRGGNAICTINRNIIFSNVENIYDEYTRDDGSLGSKLIGITCLVSRDNRTFRISNFHFDKWTEVTKVLDYMREPNSIFAGDFNKNVCLFEQLDDNNGNQLLQRLSKLDNFREKARTKNRTIDGIFALRTTQQPLQKKQFRPQTELPPQKKQLRYQTHSNNTKGYTKKQEQKLQVNSRSSNEW